MLPRIVDDSIGMYVLRRLTGRPLRPWAGDELAAGATDAASVMSTTKGQEAVAASVGIDTDHPLGPLIPLRPERFAPTRYVVSSRRDAEPVEAARLRDPIEAQQPAKPVFGAYVPPRDQARRRGLAGWAPRLAPVASLMAVLVISAVVVGAAVLRQPDGAVLSATGRPGTVSSDSGLPLAIPGTGGPSGRPTAPSVQPSGKPPKGAAATPATPSRTQRPGVTNGPTVTLPPTAHPTPGSTTRPHPTPTGQPTPSAAPTPTGGPTPTPTDAPTPTPTDPSTPTPTAPPTADPSPSA